MKNTTKKLATKKATTKKQPAKKATPKKQEAKKPTVRKDTKQHTILKMLARKSGATIQQLHEATGWKITTLRGTPGALKIKLGLEIESERKKGKDTVYKIKGGLGGLNIA